MKTYVGSYKTFESSQFSSCSVSVDCALLCSKSVVILNRAIWVMTHEWISLKLIFSVSALCRYVKYMLNTTNVWGILNMYANSYLPLSRVVKYVVLVLKESYHRAKYLKTTLCCKSIRSFSFLWRKMPMFWREGKREGGKPLPLAFQYLIFMV